MSVVAAALCLGQLLGATEAGAVSIPVERAWAEGTNWEHHDRFLGMPDTWVYVPDTFSERVPDLRGAVFHLMGCGQMTFQIAQAGGWPEAAEAHGLVVIVPGIIDPAHPNRDAPNVACFNYGYDGGYGVYRPTRDDPDQAALIAAGRALSTDPALADLRIDPDQVYIAGMSAGGTTAIEVGCMAPDVFAGVATAVSPGMGSSQGAAVMPLRFGFDAASVAAQCRGYAEGSGAPDALRLLSEQIHAIVSDNNGLPAGAGPGDTSKFYDQQVWDGDKFCPHAYQEVRAEALTDLLGLDRAPTRAGVDIARGRGMGCPGGERSRDDAGDVKCQISRSVDRDWVALADMWVDDDGRTRLVKIEQDTLRHAWPSGPRGFGDVPATPTRDQLRADGYIDAETGEFSRDRMNGAANGIYGAIYLNERAMDFPMFIADLWADNNPRLPEGPVEGRPEHPADDPLDEPPAEEPGDEVFEPVGAPPVIDVSLAQPGPAGCLVVEGAATNLDGDLASVSVSVLGFGPRAASLADGAWSFQLCDLPAGAYTLFAVASDAAGGSSDPSPMHEVIVRGAGGDAQSVDGDLTDHSNAGRVIRFTPIYFAYRDRYCVFENFRWTCESFTLHRCSEDDDWTDEDPGCPSENQGVAGLSLEIDVALPDGQESATVGDVIRLSIRVTAEGPDTASAAYARVTLPPALSPLPGGACEAYGADVVCHLASLAPGDSVDVTLPVAATAPGELRLRVVAASPQTEAPVTAEATLIVEPAPTPPIDDVAPELGQADDPEPGQADAGADGDPGTPDRPNPTSDGPEQNDPGADGPIGREPASHQPPAAASDRKGPCGHDEGSLSPSAHVSEVGGCATASPTRSGHISPLLLLGLALLRRRRSRT